MTANKINKQKIIFGYDYFFPSGPLPNALDFDATLLNLINSKHQNAKRGSSIFTSPQLFHTNILGMVRGNPVHHWPVTEYSNLQAANYWDILDIQMCSVYSIPPDVKYIYPIVLPPHLNEWISLDVRYTKPGNFFFNNMSAVARQDVCEGRATIFLDFGQENFISKWDLDNLHQMLDLVNLRGPSRDNSNKIPPEQIVLGHNTFNGQEIYENWYSEEERKITYRNWDSVLHQTSRFYDHEHANSSALPTLEELNKDVIRQYYFIFNNKQPRPWRIDLLLAFERMGLLENKINWSWLSDREFDLDDLKRSLALFPLDNKSDKDLVQLNSQLPRPLDGEPNSTFDNVSAWTDKDSKHIFLDSYFYLCTETYMDQDGYESITEKIAKPIANGLPFLFASFPGVLRKLRELGFRTFNGFIDESYDLEPDATKRMVMIGNEVARLCALPKGVIHEWYHSQQETLIHNQQNLLKYYQNSSHTTSLIDELVKKSGGTEDK